MILVTFFEQFAGLPQTGGAGTLIEFDVSHRERAIAGG